MGIAAADQGRLSDWDEKVSKEVKETGGRRRGGIGIDILTGEGKFRT